MAQRNPLPDEFTTRPFTVAAARAAGIGEGRLRSRDVERPFHGVRVARDVDCPRPGAPPADRRDETHGDRITRRRQAIDNYRPRLLPGHYFSHCAAATVLGIPLPFRVNARPVDVAAPAPGQPPRTRGVRGHKLTQGSVRVIHCDGIPVASPIDVWLQLGEFLFPDELVAAGDYLVSPQRENDWTAERLVDVGCDPDKPYERHTLGGPGAVATGTPPMRGPLTRDDLLRATLGRSGARGIRRVREALPHIRVGSESPKETELRLVLAAAGLPEPKLNAEITCDSGAVISRADLVYFERRVIVEYDGDQHRADRAQFAHDVSRLDRLAASGWRVVRVVDSDLRFTPGRVVSRVAEALGVTLRCIPLGLTPRCAPLGEGSIAAPQSRLWSCKWALGEGDEKSG